MTDMWNVHTICVYATKCACFRAHSRPRPNYYYY